MRLPNEAERHRARRGSKHHQKTERKIARTDATMPKFIELMVRINDDVKRPY